jgi:hypothetical protein
MRYGEPTVRTNGDRSGILSGEKTLFLRWSVHSRAPPIFSCSMLPSTHHASWGNYAQLRSYVGGDINAIVRRVSNARADRFGNGGQTHAGELRRAQRAHPTEQ